MAVGLSALQRRCWSLPHVWRFGARAFSDGPRAPVPPPFRSDEGNTPGGGGCFESGSRFEGGGRFDGGGRFEGGGRFDGGGRFEGGGRFDGGGRGGRIEGEQRSA